MKKTLLATTLIMTFLLSAQCSEAFAAASSPTLPPTHSAAGEFPPPPPNSGHHPDFKKPPFNEKDFEKKKAEFEKKLKLTDTQKQKAKEIHERGAKEMKAAMDELKTTRDKIFKIENSFATDKEKRAQIEPLKNKVRTLNKKLHQIRVNNMKEFEGILSEKQLKTLNKMKENGRKDFEKTMKKIEKNNKNSAPKNGEHGKPPFPPPEFEGDFPPPPPSAK